MFPHGRYLCNVPVISVEAWHGALPERAGREDPQDVMSTQQVVSVQLASIDRPA